MRAEWSCGATNWAKTTHAHLGLQHGPPVPSRAAAPAPNRFWPHSIPKRRIIEVEQQKNIYEEANHSGHGTHALASA